MDLRERILRALYGGALVSTAALTVTACGDEPTSNTTNGWSVNNTTADMAADASSMDQGGVADQGGAMDMGGTPLDQGVGADQSSGLDQGATDQGVFDQNSLDQSIQDQGADDQGVADQGVVDQGVADQGVADQGMTDQGVADMGAVDQGMVDMASSCIDPNLNYVTLPYDQWQKDTNQLQGTRVIVCGDPEPQATCKEASDFTEIETNQFLAESLGVPTGCSGQPEPLVQQGGTFCGPIPLSRSQCCYAVDITFSFCAVGRPFTVDGEVRLADVTRRDGWCEAMELEGLDELSDEMRQEIAAAWAESGTHEHASVASFGRFLMDLMSLGAPLELVQETTKAIDDEIRHARDCFSIASAYAGFTLGPDVVNVQGSMDHAGDEAVILRDAILEGCIGETLAASVASWMAPRAQHESVRQILEGISQDEGDHAVLAWKFVSWMLETRPHLIGVARETFASVKVNLQGTWAWGMDVLEEAAIGHGRVRPATEEQLRLRAFLEVVQPCAQALFAQYDDVSGAVHA